MLDVEYLKKYSGKNYQKLRNIVKVRKINYNLNINIGEVTMEIRYYINSIYDIDLFAMAVIKEWSIENNLHWHLNYTLKEDKSTIIDKKVAYNLSIIRKTILSM